MKSVCDNAHSKVSCTNCYSNPIYVLVSVHQESVICPLLFIIAMEAHSHEFRIRCPWQLLYVDDLVLVVESLDELKMRLKNWKEGFEVNGLKVNIGKTKIMCSRHDAQYQDYICQIPMWSILEKCWSKLNLLLKLQEMGT